MLNLIKKLLILIFIINFLILNTSCEYIVFLKNGNDIDKILDPKFYSQIYSTLLKYQWPTNISYFADMTENEIAKFTRAHAGPIEQEFINNKLQEIDKNLKIVFFPTFLYELYCLYEGIMDLAIDWAKVSSGIDISDNISNKLDEILDYIGNETDTISNNLKKIFDVYRKINEKSDNDKNIPNFMLMHQTINNKLIDFIKEFEFYKNLKDNELDKLIHENILIIAHKIFEKLKDKKIDIKEFGKEEVFERVLNIEYEAHNKNMGLIYRGGSDLRAVSAPTGIKVPIEFTYFLKSPDAYKPITKEEKIEYDKLMKKEKTALTYEEEKKLTELKEKIQYLSWQDPLRSISYGNSLFAGYYSDETACSYFYMAEAEKTLPFAQVIDSIGYVLFINKNLYYKGLYLTERKKAELRKIPGSYLIDGDLFRISPLNTIIGLLSRGEVFHSRSIAYYQSPDNKPIKKGLDIVGLLIYLKDVIGYLAKPGNPVERGAQLAKFVSDRAQIIKVLNSQGGFNLDPDIVKEYYEAQKDVANTFIIMSNILKFIERKRQSKK